MNERIKVGTATVSRLEARAIVESAAKCCDDLPAAEVARLVRAAQRANRTLARQQRTAGAARVRTGPRGAGDHVEARID